MKVVILLAMEVGPSPSNKGLDCQMLVLDCQMLVIHCQMLVLGELPCIT
jgi:hypothetical protein